MKKEILYKSGEICDHCGILFKDRFDFWSTCTVHAPLAFIAKGHLWNRNPVYV